MKMRGGSWQQLSWELFSGWRWLMQSRGLMRTTKGSWTMCFTSMRRSCVGACYVPDRSIYFSDIYRLFLIRLMVSTALSQVTHLLYCVMTWYDSTHCM